MKTYTITKKNFLSWYYASGMDGDEILLNHLGRLMLVQLINDNTATITTEEIFNNCNQSAIRCYLLEEFEYDTDIFDDELGDIEKRPFEVKLI